MARATTKNSSPAKATNSQKVKAFEEAIKQANADIKSEMGVLVAKLSDRPMDVKTISTGSVVIDSITGGGFPVGRIIEIFGKEASGKTSVALTAVGNVQRAGGTAVYIDLENALDPRYARKLGVDTDELAVSQPDYAEQALNLVFKLTASGAVDVIVVDSIASMTPKAELEGDMEQQTIGLLARIMSKGLKQLATLANRTQTTLIFINQTRDAVGVFSPYGTPQTTPGGKAIKFYASQRLEITRKGVVKEGKDAIGTEVRVKVVKNKIAPPFGEAITVLTFNKGINRAAEMIEVGPLYNVIHRPNNRTYIEQATGTVIGTSKADAVANLEKDKDMMGRLSVALEAAISEDLFSENSAPAKQDPDSEENLDEEFEDLEDVIEDNENPEKIAEENREEIDK